MSGKRRGCWLGSALLALVVLALSPTAALAAARVALVVGNSAYANVEKLDNPRNDARDIAAALGRLGFEVDVKLDLDRAGLWRAVRGLAKRAEGAEAALFFYAGHGVQRNRVAYLVPTDAALNSEHDLPAFAVRLNELLAPLQEPGRTTLVFLDACRDDPFSGRAAEGGSRGLAAGAGLGEVSAPGGMLIAYATGEGDTAADGRSRNSPFTAALLRHLETPGLEVKSMLTRVRRELVAAGSKQLSETSDRLLGEFYFKPGAPPQAAAAAPAPLPAPAGDPSLAERPDFVLWKAIEASKDPALFELFLREHPGSPIAPAARSRLASLRPPPAAAPQVVAALPPPPPPPAAVARKDERGLIEPVPPDVRTRFVVPGGVNLRRARDARSARLDHLRAGTAVAAAKPAGGWAEVWTRDGKRGFVSDRYLADAPVIEQATAAPPPSKPPVVVKPPVAAEPAVPARAAGEVFRDCPDCPELVAVPPGAVTVGSPEGEPGRDRHEGPRREVRIAKPLAVGRFEVTFAEWDACVAGGGCGGHRPDDEGWGRGRRPVVNVGPADALAYLDWLGRKAGKRYRLLGEAEWEHAARAGGAPDRASPWGADDSRACRHANLHDETSWRENAFDWPAARCSDGHAGTAPVGTFGANAFGLADMLGNVAEWTAGCWAESPADLPADGAAPETGDCAMRALRGGHWSAGPDAVRHAARVAARADARTATDGFRVARDLDEGLREDGGKPPAPPTTVAAGASG